ncbi:hypothetical protein CC85DRAFT_282530 [Cutaneotrichosporon oleaginosum]|uniref:Uncharacterized protein n=1 Tax=Cutaneotrichosporon oleaginosum TaxID=879819 RepID=A0A0J0XWM7_9TREE|nr:uncharacterized protein CC85DRAFT_282530 [Cutaneotrichosporon oleaginosum]KLT45451.1 hypothetical protein CC85DRAFT_282530 [Cutaneotrichosporon oleaginosum]TXT14590.1 hypothetical protein COLE_00783 [Cutaneotrichosporon oleaginosum]
MPLTYTHRLIKSILYSIPLSSISFNSPVSPISLFHHTYCPDIVLAFSLLLDLLAFCVPAYAALISTTLHTAGGSLQAFDDRPDPRPFVVSLHLSDWCVSATVAHIIQF